MTNPTKIYTTSQVQTTFTEQLDILVKDPWLVPQKRDKGLYIGSSTESPPLLKSYIGIVWRFQPGP